MANRDEVYDRPSSPAAFWSDAPNVLAGRDRRALGTWLGVTRGGRFAALTNVRDPRARREGESRGRLVADVLRSRGSLDEAAAAAAESARAFPSFNLLLGEGGRVLYVRDDGSTPMEVSSGVHGLSNARLDVPWPKVVRATEALSAALNSPSGLDPEPLFDVLADRTVAPDAALPDTGVPLELERLLSSPFIASETYGTRCSTVLVVRRDGSIELEERSFGPGGAAGPTVRHVL